jgi:integrase
LLDRGRSEGTANLYLKNLRKCRAGKRLTERLLSPELAPLTRRTNKAALVQWARFTKNPELVENVLAIKLPPAKRAKPKLPLVTGDWQKLVKHLATCKMASEGMRHVCLVIAKRGLRVSDAIGIKRADVTSAVRTGVLSYVGKGAKRHEVSAKPILPELEALAKMTGWTTLADVVSKGQGKHAAANRVRREFKRAARELGIEGVHPHRFRRTYARHYLEEHRGDPRAAIKLQNHMGWANLNTALSYADDVDHGELSKAGDEMSERLFG